MAKLKQVLLITLLLLSALACTITTIGGPTPSPTPTAIYTQAARLAESQIISTVQARQYTATHPTATAQKPTSIKMDIPARGEP